MHIWIYQSWLQLYDLLYSRGENSSYLMYLLGGVNELMCVNYLSNNWHVCSGKLNKHLIKLYFSYFHYFTFEIGAGMFIVKI